MIEDKMDEIASKFLSSLSKLICNLDMKIFGSRIVISTPIFIDLTTTNIEAELLQYHHDFSYILFNKMQEMAK